MSEQTRLAEIMKILQVVPSFHPSWGGPFTLIDAISRALVKRGHDVTILTSTLGSNKRISSFEELEGIKINYFRNYLSSKNLNFFLSLDMPMFLRKAVRNFDIIHLQGYRNFQNLVVQHFARNYQIPYVLQAHGTLPLLMGKSGLKRVFDSLIGYKMLKNASKVVAINEPEALRYFSMGIPQKMIEIIPNGIDISQYQKLPARGRFRDKFHISEEQKVVLYLGRIHKIKGIDILIKAFAKALDEFKVGTKLVIVGPDHGHLNQLKLLVESLKIRDHVVFSGPIYGQEKLQVFVDSDVFVLPSRYEIFGISLIEAAACGLPVIAPNMDNLDGLVLENKTGLTFEVGNIRQLTRALIFLLENEEVRINFGKAGKKFVSNNFNIDKSVDRLESLYFESSKNTKR